MTFRLSSTERIALEHLASAPKPWDGKRVDSIPTTRSALTRLLSLGLVRSRLDDDLPLGLQSDTPLWLTPAGRDALARARVAERARTP
jgi:hypothetical protein